MSETEPEQHNSLSLDSLRAKLVYRRERLALAEAMGHPKHIARCSGRIDSLVIKICSLERNA